MTIPELVTQRLILRGHRLEDFPACATMWGDPIVTRHIGGRPFTEQESWNRMLRYVGHWSLLGFGFWAIADKATGQFLGEAGFADFKRAIDPPLNGTPEIGWALVPSAHGRGLATEAILAALAWGDRHLAAARTVCLIDPPNVASIRVAQKCGYRQYSETRLDKTLVGLFERHRP